LNIYSKTLHNAEKRAIGLKEVEKLALDMEIILKTDKESGIFLEERFCLGHLGESMALGGRY